MKNRELVEILQRMDPEKEIVMELKVAGVNYGLAPVNIVAHSRYSKEIIFSAREI